MKSHRTPWNTHVYHLNEGDELGHQHVLSQEDLLRPIEALDDIAELRVASYNVKNLFGQEADAWSMRPDQKTEPAQVRALGHVIADIDAEVIAFQEVQNERVLRSLFTRYVNRKLLHRDNRYDTFVCIPANDPRGINVALATKRAVRGTVTFHDYEFMSDDDKSMRLSRDLLGVEIFATPHYRLLVFVVHLKSKIGGVEAEQRRNRQASEVRLLLEQPMLGGIPYIDQDMLLLGDLNDDPNSEAVALLKGEGSSHPLVDVLQNVEPNITYPTYNTGYPPQRLDYAFASPSITKRTTMPQIHRHDRAAEASDHYPISVVVEVPAPKHA